MRKRRLITGNEACGEAAIKAGCRFYAGYPITPQNELPAFMSTRMDEINGVFIQAESELAAINMVFGASVAGARAMTSSSSPGISLKQEGISYLAACELPAVIINVMRGGPGLGNIAPAQSDYFQATKGGGHGDYNMITLAPSCCQEMYELTYESFDLADKYRNPVMILSDGMTGQMMEPVRMGNRKSKTKNRNVKPWALTGAKNREPNIIRSLFLKEGMLEKLNERLQKKFKLMEKNEVRFSEYGTNKADFILVSYGVMSRIVRSCVDKLRKKGINVGLFRPISLWPFPYDALKALKKKKTKFLVVEMSAGQMVEDARLAIQDDRRVMFYGRAGGGVPTESAIMDIVNKNI